MKSFTLENGMAGYSLAAVHRQRAEQLGPLPALRTKRYGMWHDLSWEGYRADALACAAALVDVGIQLGDRVGILSENRSEWLIADMGILATGAINVPSHAPLTAKQIHFQLAESEVRWLFISTQDQLNKVQSILSDLPSLAGLTIFDNQNASKTLCPWSSFLQKGRTRLRDLAGELTRRESAVSPDSLATIMYTSGTTGNPKGVMLSHGNLMSNALACQEASPREADALLLNWLPFSHIYARTIDHYLSIISGVTLCLSESPDTVVLDLFDIRPTHMSSVPRFYEKVLASTASLSFQDRGHRLRNIFGPRIEWLSSGGAPLAPSVAEAYIESGLLLLQGYGLTESSPVITFNRKEHYRIETVGPAIPGVEIKIAADGEILTRGPHVMKGYWKNPEATAASIQDGWLYTGDLGRLDHGFLTVTGRKKELLVLSNGKKVVPSFLETLLVADEMIDQAIVCGEARPYLTAIIVPDWPNVKTKLIDRGRVNVTDRGPVIEDPAVIDLIRERIIMKLAELAPWEQIKRFKVLFSGFTVEAEEMTVSLKIRRNVIYQNYASLVNSMYDQNQEIDEE